MNKKQTLILGAIAGLLTLGATSTTTFAKEAAHAAPHAKKVAAIAPKAVAPKAVADKNACNGKNGCKGKDSKAIQTQDAHGKKVVADKNSCKSKNACKSGEKKATATAPASAKKTAPVVKH